MPLPPHNLLADETSPYLRQHSENPVHWRPWTNATLAEAEELDRPILLSVGYAACHWCHVMAHESFEDQTVADVMNRLYINIKVDREERPDIDQIYMAALSATGEQGGWPLTMFLTPQGKPFWGGTYFPRQSRYGRPGIIEVLNSVHRAWIENRQKIVESADVLTNHVAERLGGNGRDAAVTDRALPDLADAIQRMVDLQSGGIRGAPKFPNAPFMHTLWFNWLATGNTANRDAVLISLRGMLAGGIYDHIGGGLSRYSTDADWLIPHFEKMLYDNAQLLPLAGWAHAETGDNLFRVRIEETVSWLLREMRTPNGAFASSLDADTEGEEGLFYTWDRSEIESILGDKTADFLTVYELAAPATWEGKPVIHMPGQAARNDELFADHFESSRERLREARDRRTRPGRDDKVLTDWNGLLIDALARAGRQFSRPDWIAAAREAFDAIVDASASDARLPHSILGERRLYPALSSDYAALISASVSLFEATGEPHYVDTARQLEVTLTQWHGDRDGTGYHLTASDSTDLPMRIRGDSDEAIPSATAQIIAALARLAELTGDATLRARCDAVAEAAMARAANQNYGQAGIVNATALASQPIRLVTVDEAGSNHFAVIADRHPDPRRVDIQLTVGDDAGLAELPGGVMPDTGTAGAWYCTGNVCLPVISDPDDLAATLRRRP